MPLGSKMFIHKVKWHFATLLFQNNIKKEVGQSYCNCKHN